MPLQNTSGAVDRLATAAGTTSPKAFTAESEETALERIEAVIERYPWPTVLIALGVGYLIARRMR